MNHQKDNVDLTHIIARVAVAEEKTSVHSSILGEHANILSGLKTSHYKQADILNQHDTELKIQKVTLESKFDAVIKQSESLEKSINSLKNVVDEIVPVLNNWISSKKGADKANAKILRITLGIIGAVSAIVGTIVGVLKYMGS